MNLICYICENLICEKCGKVDGDGMWSPTIEGWLCENHYEQLEQIIEKFIQADRLNPETLDAACPHKRCDSQNTIRQDREDGSKNLSRLGN